MTDRGYPDSWALAKLGDLLSLNYGKGLPGKNRSGTAYPVYGSNGIVGSHKQPLTAGPTIVIGRKGSIGEIHFSKTPCFPIDTTYYIDNFHGMPERYWYYLLKQLRLANLNKATAIPGLNREDAYKQVVPVAPLNEQKRIADKLDVLLERIDSCRERLAQVPDLLKRMRQSALSAAIAGNLTDEWLRLKGKSRNVNTKALKEVANFIDYRGKTPAKTLSGVPLITAKNIRRGHLSEEPREFIAESSYERWMTRGFPSKYDVLFTTEAPLGNSACIDWEYKFALAQRIICLNPKRYEELDGRYLALIVQTNDFQQRLNDQATGTTVAGIKASRLKELEISFPSLDEQHQVVKEAHKLFALCDGIQKRVEIATLELERMVPAILNKAFSGDLVTQDSNDEPAAELLCNLQKEPGAAVSNGKSKLPNNTSRLSNKASAEVMTGF